jgi:hypothetical protein
MYFRRGVPTFKTYLLPSSSGQKICLENGGTLFFKTLHSSTVISICDSGVNNEFIDFDQFECL